MASQSAATLEAELRRDGFRPGAPRQVTAWSEEIDAGVAAEAICPAGCGVLGLKLKPFHRGESYRALMACPVCHAAEEL